MTVVIPFERVVLEWPLPLIPLKSPVHAVDLLASPTMNPQRSLYFEKGGDVVHGSGGRVHGRVFGLHAIDTDLDVLMSYMTYFNVHLARGALHGTLLNLLVLLVRVDRELMHRALCSYLRNYHL